MKWQGGTGGFKAVHEWEPTACMRAALCEKIALYPFLIFQTVRERETSALFGAESNFGSFAGADSLLFTRRFDLPDFFCTVGWIPVI